jgi:hypothetical protein
MSKMHTVPMSAWVLPLAIGLGSQAAMAQRAHHPHIQIVSGRGAPGGARALTPYFKGLAASFGEAYPQIEANADGYDLWPCVGGSSDCATVGNPAVPLPTTALVVGFPAYGWALQNTKGIGNGTGCDALVNGTGAGGSPYEPCAQILDWHEDNTGDTTDDILWRATVTQGGNVVYATGTVDFGALGPNTVYPLQVVIYDDANLGYWPGAQTGPNNGNCSADEFYPLSTPAFPPSGIYVISAGKTCGRPQPGLAQVETVTILATPSYTKVSGNACTSKNVASPCYVVKYTHQHEIHQNFTIELD